MNVDVRFGSLADVTRCPRDVRFTPTNNRKSGHQQTANKRLLVAPIARRPRTFKTDLVISCQVATGLRNCSTENLPAFAH
jgi:hypothetical protein